MGNMADFCNAGHDPDQLQQNGKIIRNMIVDNRIQVNELPVIPSFLQQKIDELLKQQNYDRLQINKKFWRVTKPCLFYYSNQIESFESSPKGLCSIFLINSENQFQGYFKGNVSDSGLRQNKGSIYVFANGDYFIGSRLKNDYGIYCDYKKQYRYEGDWVNGKPHGIGQQYTDCGTYQGYFLLGKKNGQGKYSFKNGLIYQGQFLHNQITGRGALSDINQNYLYNGYFKNGLKHGMGKQKSKQYLFQGNFQNNVKKGHGKITYLKINYQYQGNFQNDCPNGKGRQRKGSKLIEGVWKDGVLKNILFQQNS